MQNYPIMADATPGKARGGEFPGLIGRPPMMAWLGASRPPSPRVARSSWGSFLPPPLLSVAGHFSIISEILKLRINHTGQELDVGTNCILRTR